MKRNVINVMAGLLVALAGVLTGCGGGGGSSGPGAPATTAILKLAINNLPNGVKVGALQVYFNLPAGVVPVTLSGADASGAVVYNGAISISLATFVYPVVAVAVGSVTGLSSGEYATMNCAINPGTTVSAASFPAYATIDIADDTSSASLVGTITVPIVVTLQ